MSTLQPYRFFNTHIPFGLYLPDQSRVDLARFLYLIQAAALVPHVGQLAVPWAKAYNGNPQGDRRNGVGPEIPIAEGAGGLLGNRPIGPHEGARQSTVMKERRELAEDGVLVIAAALDSRGALMAPLSLETQGVFISDDHKRVFDEIRAAAERGIREFSGSRSVDREAVAKVIRSRVRDILRRRNYSYAVVLPVISVIGEDHGADDTWMEKDFF